MKKLILLSVLLLLTSVFISNEAFGQHANDLDHGTHFVLEDGGGSSRLASGCLDPEKCILTKRVRVSVANFFNYDWPGLTPPGNGIGPVLPPAPQFIYARCTVGDYSTVPVKLVDFANTHHDNIFTQVVEFNIPIESECVNYDPQNGPSLNLSYTVELLDLLPDGTYQEYPLFGAIFPGGLFDCNVFPHICANGDYSLSATEYIDVCCQECQNGLRNSNDQFASDEEKLAFNVQPNPFKRNIEVEFSVSETSDVDIQIFGLNGQKLMSYHQTKEVGNHQVVLNTSKLASGIYYCQIQTIDGSAMQKIIKMN